MPLFNYTARDMTGKITKGVLETENQTAVYSTLKQRKLIPVEVKKSSSLDFDIEFDTGVSVKHLAIFARQFATMFRAGIPIVRIIDILKKQTESKKLSKILERIYEDLQKGISLSTSMKENRDTFSTLFINMVEAGEISGTLDKSLDKVAINLEKEFRLNSKIKGALVYPSIVIFICTVAIGVLLTLVVPQFSKIFTEAGAKLPWTTQFLMDFGIFMQKFWWLVFLLGGIVFFAFTKFKKTATGKEIIDDMALKLPQISNVTKKVLAARLARVCGSMLSSGVSLIRTLEVAEKIVDNKFAQIGIKKVQEDVSKGASLSKAIADMGLFPDMLPQMISVGEESGSLDQMLEKTADFYEEESEAAIAGLTQLIEPAVLLVMAVVVGFIVVSIITPMMEMTKVVGG